jgi:hypothetical protein
LNRVKPKGHKANDAWWEPALRKAAANKKGFGAPLRASSAAVLTGKMGFLVGLLWQLYSRTEGC